MPRGELREHVEMIELRDGLLFASWIDDEMGLLAQIIDLETDTVLAAVLADGQPRTQILTGRLVAFDKVPTALTYYPGRPAIKVGDFVELLAHDDLLVAVSPCPMGDQEDLTGIEAFTCHPVRVAIYEGEDGPLETAPDPQRKTMNAVDFVKAGRPDMVVGKVGGTT